jgi:hypothetical protein
VIVMSGGLTNKHAGETYRSALALAMANDKIARRYSALPVCLANVITEPQHGQSVAASEQEAARSTKSSSRPRPGVMSLEVE